MARRGGTRIVGTAPPELLPGLALLDLGERCGRLVLLDDLPFDRRGPLHRFRLRGEHLRGRPGAPRPAPGPGDRVWTVPVRSPSGVPLREVRLEGGSEWARRAMRQVEQDYADAPFFEHYRCDVARVLLRQRRWLIDLQLDSMRLLWRGFGLRERFEWATRLGGGRDAEARARLCAELGAGLCLLRDSTPADDAAALQASGVPTLPQAFRALGPGGLSRRRPPLSALDALLRLGPDARWLLSTGRDAEQRVRPPRRPSPGRARGAALAGGTRSATLRG